MLGFLDVIVLVFVFGGFLLFFCGGLLFLFFKHEHNAFLPSSPTFPNATNYFFVLVGFVNDC